MGMKVLPSGIPEVLLIEPQVFGDERGFFMETFQARRYAEAGIDAVFVQDNHSSSRQGILRGLHYQVRQPQGKLLRLAAGVIYDVAVDLRRSSPMFGQWVGSILSGENKRQLWIPPGFANGFYVLSGPAELLYKTTDYYAPEWERTILWNDPQLGIDWPLIDGKPPILSPKDAGGTCFGQAEVYP
jgi:dTDP-4-dehydrorhamnose 3,5-epimerase